MNANQQSIPTPPPSSPPAAQAAGFNTLALNVDFSTSDYAITSNWLDCAGNNTSKLWHLTAQPNLPSCSRIFQTNDNGATAEQFQLQAGDPNFILIQTCIPGACFTYPNFYVETTERIDTLSGPPANPAMTGVWSGQASNGAEVFDEIELDYIEQLNFGNGGGDAAWHDHSASNTGNWVWNTGVDSPVAPAFPFSTSYQKYGFLFTADGSTHQYACGFINDVLADNCAQIDTHSSSPNQFLYRSLMKMDMGGSNTGFTTSMLVKNVKVWSCANWQEPGSTYSAAHMCNGSILSNTTTAQGKNLVYWH